MITRTFHEEQVFFQKIKFSGSEQQLFLLLHKSSFISRWLYNKRQTLPTWRDRDWWKPRDTRLPEARGKNARGVHRRGWRALVLHW